MRQLEGQGLFVLQTRLQSLPISSGATIPDSFLFPEPGSLNARVNQTHSLFLQCSKFKKLSGFELLFA
jgi:hypothetical protein